MPIDGETDGLTNGLILFHSKTAILWRFDITGNNKTYLRRHVKCPGRLHGFNQIWIL